MLVMEKLNNDEHRNRFFEINESNFIKYAQEKQENVYESHDKNWYVNEHDILCFTLIIISEYTKQYELFENLFSQSIAQNAIEKN